MPIYKINNFKPTAQQHGSTNCATKHEPVQQNHNGTQQNKDNHNSNNHSTTNHNNNNIADLHQLTSKQQFATLRRPASKIRSTDDETIVEQEIRIQLEKEKEIEALRSAGAETTSNNNNLQIPEPTKDSTKVTEPGSTLHLNGTVASNRKVFERDLSSPQDRDTCTNDAATSRLDPNAGKQRKRSIVHPFEDVDGLESKLKFIQPQNETVIEKEVRLTIQREGSLRRARGFPLQVHQNENETNVEIPLLSLKINEPIDGKHALRSPGDTLARDNPNSVKGEQINARRLATNRLKQEILKERQREVDLRQQGKIMTLSEERAALDAAIIEELVAKELEERQRLESQKSNLPSDVRKGAGYEKDKGKVQVQYQTMSSAHSGTVGCGSSTSDSRQKQIVDVRACEPRLDAESRIEEEIKEIKRREQELRDQRLEMGISPATTPTSHENQATFITSYRRRR